MISFFACLILLLLIDIRIAYSRVIEKVFRVDDRPTPAIAHPDGVDYIPMKTWRIFLIQLLNIAGLGPIYGALVRRLLGALGLPVDRIRHHPGRRRTRLPLRHDERAQRRQVHLRSGGTLHG